MKNLLTLCFLVVFTSGSFSQNALPAPSLHISTNADAACVILKWESSNDDISGYVIEKKEGNGYWLIIAQAEPNEKFFIDQQVSSSETFYRIRTFAKERLSNYYNVKGCQNLAGFKNLSQY